MLHNAAYVMAFRAPLVCGDVCGGQVEDEVRGVDAVGQPVPQLIEPVHRLGRIPVVDGMPAARMTMYSQHLHFTNVV